MLTALLAVLFTAIAVPGLLLAAETAMPPLAANSSQETISLATALFKTVGALVVVVGLMLLTLHLIRKAGLARTGHRRGGLIRVLDTQMLGPKKYVAVLEVAGQFMAVGITDQQISLLTPLAENDRLSKAAHSTTSGDHLPASFAAVLNRAVRNVTGKKEEQ